MKKEEIMENIFVVTTLVIVIAIVFGFLSFTKSIKGMQNDIENIQTQLYWISCKNKVFEEIKIEYDNKSMGLAEFSKINKKYGQHGKDWRFFVKYDGRIPTSVRIEACLDK